MLRTGEVFSVAGCLHPGYNEFNESASLHRYLFLMATSYELHTWFIFNFCFQFYHLALTFKQCTL